MLSEVVSEVLFSCDGFCFDVFAVSGDDVACFCDSHHVGSVVMVMATSTNHCDGSMVHHPLTELLQYIILKINHNFWQYHISCKFCLPID